MKKASIETAVGLFVFIGILCVGYLTVKLGKMEILGKNYYHVQAQFESVAGLKVGASVEMAGVPIGKVEAIDLDIEQQVARVQMKIQSDVAITDDTIASVKTAGHRKFGHYHTDRNISRAYSCRHGKPETRCRYCRFRTDSIL